MWFSNFESVYLLLILIVLVRVLLNRSNFTILVVLCFTASLSFVFFESFWSVCPLVWYFLKHSLLDLVVPDQYDSPGRSPDSRGERLFTCSNQDFATVPIPPNNSGSELFCKDKEKSLSWRNDDLSFSASPLEPLEKERYVQLGGFGLCVGLLAGTSQIALAVLRKLPYTQQVIERMTNWGCSRLLLSWLAHSNPGPLPEKPLFHLMVWVLLINVVILYVIMKMIHLIP